MKLAHNLILTWFLLIAFILAACASEGSTPADTETTAIDTTTPVLDNRDMITVTATNPPAHQTPTIVLPAPTTAAPLPTPTITEPLPEPSPTPIILCPERTGPEKEWDCQEDDRAGVRQCRPVALEPPQVCYEDLFNGFALTLPVDWQIHTTNYLRQPYRPSNMMVKDHSISMYEQDQLSGATIIRVFVPQEASLSAWLTNMRRTNPGQVSGTRTEISLGGHPAAIWINDCSPGYYREVHVAVHNGERVIWWLAYAYAEAGIVGLRQMLATVRFTDAPAIPVEIPGDIWQEAMQGCW